MQAAEGCEGITVSTMAEARFFGEAGFRDITYAVPLAPARAQEALTLARSLDRLNLIVDDTVAVDAIEATAREQGLRASVLMKVDCGYHRAGVDPEGSAAVALARRLADCRWIDFVGVLTHAGHAYGCRNVEGVQEVAEQERAVTVGCAERLRAEGIEVKEVSVGSTPTMSVAKRMGGVTEVRAGNYVFYDAFQAALGSCTASDPAFTVLATVIGRYPHRGAVVLDAGALALSKDLGARQVDPDAGFGVLMPPDQSRAWKHLRLYALSQEHGHVAMRGDLGDVDLRVGDKVRIVPNHSCLSAALFDRYHVESQGRVCGVWRPVRGW